MSLRKALSNTRKSVSSLLQTRRTWLKKTQLRLIFNPHLGVWKSDETPFLVFDILPGAAYLNTYLFAKFK